jgi:murein DD-endopeptidase MepM/ murein hydrolase activator NlpD
MRRFTAIAFAIMIMGLFPTSPSTAGVPGEGLVATDVRAQDAKKSRKGKACPTKNFWVGAGWGADRGKRSHEGIDLGGKRGAPIFAVEAGQINRTKRQSNGALQIVLRGKTGSKYYYGHMDKVLIKGGQRVKKGQMIGKMGDSGSPGQVHLHFEYWKSGRESAAINPTKFLKRACKSI